MEASRTELLARRNTRWYPLFCAVMFTPFMLPVIVLFWQQNGLDLVAVYQLQAIFALAVLLFEVPTGLVADRIGKRTSLVLGTAITLAGMVVYGVGAGFAPFVMAEVVLALGVSLQSGSGSALLYDSLRALDRADDFERHEGRARAVQLLSFASCALIGGAVGARSTRAAVWLTAAGPLLALAAAGALSEIQRPARGGSWRDGIGAYGALLAAATRFVRRQQLVRWYVLLLALIAGSGLWLFWLCQPYMEQSGLPMWTFGGVFALFNIVAAVASHLAHRVDRRCGERGTIGLLLALQTLPPALMAALRSRAGVLFALGQQLARGLATPVASARILRFTYADKRATVLSLAAMAGRLFYAATATLVGALAEHASLGDALWAQAAALVLLSALLGGAFLAIPAKYRRVKDVVRSKQ